MDHLFFDHLKSVFFFFNSTMLTIYNIVRWHLIAHKIDGSNDASTSFFLLFLFFSSFSDCYCSIAQWVMSVLSFSYALITAKRFLLSVSSALTIRRTLRWTFCKERLARKDTRKLKFEAARFEPSILITFYHWKFFAGAGDWTRVCTPNHVFDAFTAKQHWCRHEN